MDGPMPIHTGHQMPFKNQPDTKKRGPIILHAHLACLQQEHARCLRVEARLVLALQPFLLSSVTLVKAY